MSHKGLNLIVDKMNYHAHICAIYFPFTKYVVNMNGFVGVGDGEMGMIKYERESIVFLH